MPAGFFIARFDVPFSASAAALYIGNGIIVGMDAGEVRYDGQYNTLPDGSLQGEVQLRVGVPTPLITGQVLQPGVGIKLQVHLPANFAQGQQINFNIGGKLVGTVFTKLRDLP